MNIQVKHNGTNITGFVTEYSREHKICTGIGSLTVGIVNTINRTFEPWDSIDIYENGDFKTRYYISSVENNIPSGIITLDCQDNSKRLVDYFIPNTYIVEEPTYTRYWIERFLDEVGVSYSFLTSSQGNLLSNSTQLGMVSAYEQILTLLQMSGWYIYFDGNGTAIIGSLDIDLASSTGSVGKTDILNIAKISDDKMLRNRALVLGAFDPYTMSYASADVSVHTRWNYDHSDQRAIVISNSNIPNNESAYAMANQIIKEFARITVEKHINITGARDFNLGTALKVDSNVWKGKGLITTFGVSMRKNGLITNIILDERCPRLFGFFNFGDYVYVGTYGDGIWRKHIRFDHTWNDFSSGLTNLEITDLHINNSIFGSVSSSGDMYYTVDGGAWSKISLTGLESSLGDIVASGSPELVMFSGIVGRAVIVDKITGNIKFGVDISERINYGDYFLDNPAASFSGVMESGAGRGWIVEYNPYTGIQVDNYPISFSGNYNIQVLDIENDGSNDYVSIFGNQIVIIPFSGSGYNFGKHTSSPPNMTNDAYSFVSRNNFESFSLEGQSLYSSLSTVADNNFAMFNNESVGERDVVWIENDGLTVKIKKAHFYEEFDEILGRNRVKVSTTTSPETSLLTTGNAIEGIYESEPGIYKIYNSIQDNEQPGILLEISRKVMEWDSINNTVSANSEIALYSIPRDPNGDSTVNQNATANTVTFNNIIYTYLIHHNSASSGLTTNIQNYIKIFQFITSMEYGGTSSGLIHTEQFESASGTLDSPHWVIRSIGGTGTLQIPNMPFLFQYGDSILMALYISEWNEHISGFATELRNWLLYSKGGGAFSKILVQSTNDDDDPNFLLSSGTPFNESYTGSNQLGNAGLMLYARAFDRPVTYIFNGDSVSILSLATDVPFYWKKSNIYPIFGVFSTNYIAKNGTQWFWVNQHSISVTGEISFQANFQPLFPFLTSSSVTPEFFWYAFDGDTSRYNILRHSETGFISAIDPFSQPNFTGTLGIVAGNIFANFQSTGGILKVLYIDTGVGITNTVAGYQVLRRDGENFQLIQEEMYPIRLDISNNSPVLTAGSWETTFVSNYVYGDTLAQVIFASGLPTLINDYRYAFLEPAFGNISPSGLGVQSIGLYVSGSGIYGADILTYSGGFQLLYEIPSGAGYRIETSNYGIGGQYIFVTASGNTIAPSFYQKDPGAFTFTSYSGLPDSRATIIRLDDRI